MYGRVFFVALGLVGAVGAAAIYGVGAPPRRVRRASRPARWSPSPRSSTRVYQPLTGLTNARVDLMTSMVSFERVFEVLDAPEPIQRAARRRRPRRTRPGGSTFDDVWFRYPPAADDRDRLARAARRRATDPDRDVLDGRDARRRCRARPSPSSARRAPASRRSSRSSRGCTTSPAAPCASTATTSATSRSTSLRAAIGVVAQDPHLFHESIGDNLRYAKPDATDDELVAACRAARIHDTIAALPDGYDTVVGDRGYRLSGGEKQRLAIARLLLKDPAMMILDEATSHLDNDNEAQVQAALDARAVRAARRSSSPTACRRSAHADRIAVLDDGRIVELGTHDELVALDGVRRAAPRRRNPPARLAPNPKPKLALRCGTTAHERQLRNASAKSALRCGTTAHERQLRLDVGGSAGRGRPPGWARSPRSALSIRSTSAPVRRIYAVSQLVVLHICPCRMPRLMIDLDVEPDRRHAEVGVYEGAIAQANGWVAHELDQAGCVQRFEEHDLAVRVGSPTGAAPSLSRTRSARPLPGRPFTAISFVRLASSS